MSVRPERAPERSLVGSGAAPGAIRGGRGRTGRRRPDRASDTGGNAPDDALNHRAQRFDWVGGWVAPGGRWWDVSDRDSSQALSPCLIGPGGNKRRKLGVPCG
jgi:hypothetical protein